MALIVEDGSIVDNADSYISVANAITFLNDYYGSEDSETVTFLAFSTENQEIFLRQATYVLDRRYRKRWKGIKNVQTQSLDWPRLDVYDEDDWLVPHDDIPRRLKRAEVEIAKRLGAGVEIFEDGNLARNIRSEKVDVIAISYFQGTSFEKVFEGIDAILKGLIEDENRIRRS